MVCYVAAKLIDDNQSEQKYPKFPFKNLQYYLTGGSLLRNMMQTECASEMQAWRCLFAILG
jgi:hypothetical protein